MVLGLGSWVLQVLVGTRARLRHLCVDLRRLASMLMGTLRAPSAVLLRCSPNNMGRKSCASSCLGPLLLPPLVGSWIARLERIGAGSGQWMGGTIGLTQT